MGTASTNNLRPVDHCVNYVLKLTLIKYVKLVRLGVQFDFRNFKIDRKNLLQVRTCR